jgi:hypothetical protein
MERVGRDGKIAQTKYMETADRENNNFYLLFQTSNNIQLKNSLYLCSIILYRSWFSKNWMCAVRPIHESIVLSKTQVNSDLYHLLFFYLEVNVESVH